VLRNSASLACSIKRWVCQQISDDGQLDSFAKQTSFSAASTSSSSRTLLATFLGSCGLLDRCRSNISSRQLRVTRSRNDQQSPWDGGTAAAHGHPAVQRVPCPACPAQQKLDFACVRESGTLHASVSVHPDTIDISERSALLLVLHFKLRQGKILLHEIYLAASGLEGESWNSQPNCNQCLLYTCVSKQQCAFRHVPRLVVPYVSSQHLQQQSIVLDRSVWSIHMCNPFAERQALGAMIV